MNQLSPANWMSGPYVQPKEVGQLVLPGTHDSGTYNLTNALSQIKYDNIAFLWGLSAGSAPANANPANMPPFYVGSQLYDFIFSLVHDVSQAQDQSVAQQLAGGIRYFDLRVYWDTTQNDLYIQHGLMGDKLSTLLQDVGAFVTTAGSNGRELIFLEVSHTNFDVQPAGINALVALLNRSIGAQNLYNPASLASLASAQLSTITSQGSRVIVLNTDQNIQYPAGSPLLTTAGFQDSGRSGDGVDQVNSLTLAEAVGLQQSRTCPFYQIAWTLTPQLVDIADEATWRVAGNAARPVLKNLALQANAQLQSFFENNRSYPFNLITVDWYECNSNVVSVAWALSAG